jgi:hypothetical protein
MIAQSHRGIISHVMMFFAGALFALVAASVVRAGTVSGTVSNGTTGKPAGGVDVILIQLLGEMQPVANTKADASGQFHFDNAMLGTAPMLIRVPYEGVNYHHPVPPGTKTADVNIYEVSKEPKTYAVTKHFIVLQPRASDLLIGEEYGISNQTDPPVSYFRPDGTFEFRLPEGAQLNQASATGPEGMPVVQGTIDKGNGVLAVSFPFRPGETNIRISYQLPYPSNQATLRVVSSYAVENTLIVAPPSVSVNSPEFVPAGSDQGFSLYRRNGIAAAQDISIRVSGTAPVEAAGQAGDQGNNQDGGAESAAGSAAESPPAAAVMPMPGRLENVKWIIVVGFAGLFAMGLAFLWRRPQLAAVQTPEVVAPECIVTGAIPAQAISATRTEAAVQQASGAVQGRLDEIKDRLFRLELRRQAGTISEEEYSRQRADAEGRIRELLRD